MCNKAKMVSVIMPVYNSEKYVKRAVESVMVQTYTNLQLVLIDDGSIDQSGKICDDLAKLDSRIYVIHKKNGGLCSARNAGLDIADGEYVMFIDNDDEYEKKCLEVAVNAIDSMQTDIARFNCRQILYFSNGRKKERVYGTLGMCSSEAKVWTQREIYENYILMMRSGALLGVWDGIYKKELFHSIRFDESMKYGYEDQEMNLQLYAVAKKIAFIPDALYKYKKRETHSVSAQFHFNHIESAIKVANLEKKILSKNNVEKKVLLVRKSFFLEHVIRSLCKECPYGIKKKIEIIRSLHNEPAYSNISDSAYLNRLLPYFIVNYLFDKEHYYFLYMFSSIIIKMRGNL